jgi:hypothetical protein
VLQQQRTQQQIGPWGESGPLDIVLKYLSLQLVRFQSFSQGVRDMKVVIREFPFFVAFNLA